MPLPDGIVAVVKAECATCVLVAPVLRQLRESGAALTVYTQDDPTFPEGVEPLDSTTTSPSRTTTTSRRSRP